MKQPIDFQNTFLSQVQMDKIPMTIFLVNGFQIRGTLKGFDNFTIEVDAEGRQQVIFKHAISTMVPLRPVKLQTHT